MIEPAVLAAGPIRSIRSRIPRFTTTFAVGTPTRIVARRSAGCRATAAMALTPSRAFVLLLTIGPETSPTDSALPLA